jgi:hypothetical protein
VPEGVDFVRGVLRACSTSVRCLGAGEAVGCVADALAQNGHRVRARPGFEVGVSLTAVVELRKGVALDGSTVARLHNEMVTPA